MTEEQIKETEKTAAKIPMPRLIKMIRSFIEAEKEIKSAIIPQLPLELAIAELDISGDDSKSEVSKIKEIKEKTSEVISESLKTSQQFIKKAVPGAIESAVKKIKPKENQESRIKNQEFSGDNKQLEKLNENNKIDRENASFNLEEIKDGWDEILEKVRPCNHSITAFLKTCQPVAAEEKKLVIASRYTFHLERLREPRNRKIIEDIIGGMFEIRPEIKFISEEEAKQSGYNLETKSVKENPAPDSNQETGDILNSALEIFGGKVV
jgi:DNA polymerase-3 subunit gamma/tau